MAVKNKRSYKKFDALIDASGMRQEAIAERLGVTYGAFYHWRQAPWNVSIYKMEKLAQVTGADFDELVQTAKELAEVYA